jgi:alpha-amylase
MRDFTSLRFVVPLAFTTLLLGQVGCVSIPVDDQQPALGTHVSDWRDEIIYQVITDRFADGDVNNDYTISPGALEKYQGGDWKGIEDHLDYIQALGVTTLWISPIVQNVDSDANVDGYHGYWQQDLTKLNPHMGDLGALRSMIAHAHDLDIKVVLDIVCNHMGQLFFYDINKNGLPDDDVEGSGGPDDPVIQMNEYDPPWTPGGVLSYSQEGNSGRAPLIFIDDPSINRLPGVPGILGTTGAYHGMGHILDFNDVTQRTLGDFTGGLKDIATELPAVRATLVDSFAKWVEATDLDGYRIDTIKHVESSFWPVFTNATRERLSSENKNNFLMFGEAFDGNDQLLGSFTQDDAFDSVFYFSQAFTVFDGVFENASVGGQSGTNQIEQLWDQKTVNYATNVIPGGIGVPPYEALINFIDNHDVPRFLFASNGDTTALGNALNLLLTEEGIPDIYYGTEQEFHGGNDPANREVLWNTNFDTQGNTFLHIQKLIQIRKAYTALRRGQTSVRWSSGDTGSEMDAGIFAFERAGGDAGTAYALIVQNTNAFQTSYTANGSSVMKVTAAPGTMLVDVLNAQQSTYSVASDGSLNISLPAQSALILIPSDQIVSLN